METQITRLWFAVAFLALVNVLLISQFVNMQRYFDDMVYEHYTYRLLILTGTKPTKAVQLSTRAIRQ